MVDLAIRKEELVLGRGLIMAESIAQELRSQLVDRLSRSRNNTSMQHLIELAREILDGFEPILARTLADTDIASWIAGADRVAGVLPESALLELESGVLIPGGQPPGPPFVFSPTAAGGDDEPVIRFPAIEEAAESLSEKRIVSPEEFNAISDEARRRSFTVAGEESEDAIRTIRDLLTEDIREGTSLRSFRKRLDESLEGSLLGPAHRETTYRNAVQSAFHEGHDHLASHPIVADLFPYQSYDPIDDGRVRPEHLALKKLGLSGTNIYHRNDPFWNLWTPPNGHRCRCGTNLHTIESAARHGVREAQEWLRTGVEPNHEFRLGIIPFAPDPGFANRGRRAAAAA